MHLRAAEPHEHRSRALSSSAGVSGAEIGDQLASVSSPALLGRGRELETLWGLIDSVRLRGAACIVRGEPGVGKSALLEQAAARAKQDGMLVLRTIGVQSEAQMPFAGLHQLLRPILTYASELPAAQRTTSWERLASAPTLPNSSSPRWPR
jgi:AAA ATPase domain